MTFSTSCFYSQERRFFVLEYQKTHFPALHYLKKEVEEWPILDKHHGLTPLEKFQFFDFFNFFFYSLQRRFLLLEYSKTHFPGLYCPKKKGRKQPIFNQNHAPNPLEKFQFFDFSNFFFSQPTQTFFRARILYNTFFLTYIA